MIYFLKVDISRFVSFGLKFSKIDVDIKLDCEATRITLLFLQILFEQVAFSRSVEFDNLTHTLKIRKNFNFSCQNSFFFDFLNSVFRSCSVDFQLFTVFPIAILSNKLHVKLQTKWKSTGCNCSSPLNVIWNFSPNFFCLFISFQEMSFVFVRF